VSPALNVGCCLPVANASSAILSKSAIVIYLLNCYRPSATFSAVFASVLTAVTRKSGAKLLIYFGLAKGE
jgi:hypothetical protein